MKFIKKFSFLLSVLLLASTCRATENILPEQPKNQQVESSADSESEPWKVAYFAEGCFLSAEEIFQRFKGVKEVISGYSGGSKPNPTSEQVNAGDTNYAETIKIVYDASVINYRTLVTIFFGSQDPTQTNGQGPDIGKQFRSVIFYQNDEEKAIAEEIRQQLSKSGLYDKPIAVEITKFTKFYDAEDDHQGYYTNHLYTPYCLAVSRPRIERTVKKFKRLLKDGYK